MKSKSLKLFVKGMIVAGAAFAMAACDDVTKPAPIEAAEEEQVQEGQGEGGLVQDGQGQGQVGNGEVQGGADAGTGTGSNGSQDTGFGESNSSASVLPSSSDAASVQSSSSEAPVLPKIYLANDTEEEKNFMSVEYKPGSGADGEGILAYPTHMTTNPDQKHAVVIWGPGGGTAPSAYEGMIRRLASHGFVVLALSSSPGDGSKAIAAMNWLDDQNKNAASPLFGKLDMNTVIPWAVLNLNVPLLRMIVLLLLSLTIAVLGIIPVPTRFPPTRASPFFMAKVAWNVAMPKMITIGAM